MFGQEACKSRKSGGLIANAPFRAIGNPFGGIPVLSLANKRKADLLSLTLKIDDSEKKSHI
jgi:hypothetical protein